MLKTVAVVLTMRCDLKCSHCLRDFPRQRPDFPLELLDSLLSQARTYGASHISLTGGEPRLHPQFDQVIEKIVTHGFKWRFVSHGGETEAYIRNIERYPDSFNRMSISIDGHNAEIHDKLRNKTGSFKKATRAIKQYKSLGLYTRINHTLCQQNHTYLSEIFELAADLEIDSLGIAGTIPTPWNQEMQLSDAQSLVLWQQIQELRKQYPFRLRTVSSLYTYGGVNFCKVLNLQELTINARGELMFCCDTHSYGAVVGSLLDSNLSGLIEQWIEESGTLQKMRSQMIASGKMHEGFDTCAFCNRYFSQERKLLIPAE